MTTRKDIKKNLEVKKTHSEYDYDEPQEKVTPKAKKSKAGKEK